jgi:predicted RNA-binding Zn-ribbon protein involved in translation (DUF1610 family)
VRAYGLGVPAHHEPEPEAYVANAPACPSCGAAWSYESGGRKLSRIVGIYSLERDRTEEWLCPDCGERWARGALLGDPPLR